MPTVIINAPTKINLRLKVVGKRDDGYHFLSMLNEKLALSDRVRITAHGAPRKKVRDFPVEVICKEDPLLATEKNLVVKAARKLSQEYGIFTPLTIEIGKSIPVGAGLGGGSSDAAACFIGLNKLWGLYKSNKELAKVGVTIGADVPFFFSSGPAHVTGIGENIDADVTLPKLWVLLVNPGFEVSTRWVYESLDLKLTEKCEDDRFRPHFNNLGDLSPLVENDLEAVVGKKHPEIEEIKSYLNNKNAKIVFMSGSGPTVVGIFENKKDRDLALFGSGAYGWKFLPTENIWHRR